MYTYMMIAGYIAISFLIMGGMTWAARKDGKSDDDSIVPIFITGVAWPLTVPIFLVLAILAGIVTGVKYINVRIANRMSKFEKYGGRHG